MYKSQMQSGKSGLSTASLQGCCARLPYEHKYHWNTVIIGGDVPDSELYDMIQHSYDLIKPKLKKQGRTIDTHKPWLGSLYEAVFDEKYRNIPDDANESVDYVLNMLSEREKFVILARFRDKSLFCIYVIQTIS